MYSLIRPPRTGFRRMCCAPTPVTVARGASCSPPGDALGDALVPAGPCCSAPGSRLGRLGRRADVARRGSACGRGVRGAGCRRGVRRSRSCGAWTAVRRIPAPVAWKTASKERVKSDPRSRMRNLMPSDRSPRLMPRLRACCTVHSPVGFAVTPPRCIRRVPCSMKTRMYSLFSSTVSTCRKPAARIPPPERAGIAARSGLRVAVPGRCPRHAGSSTQWTAQRHAGFRQLAVDAAVSPPRILLRQANDEACDARECWRAAGLAPVARLVLSRGQPAVPGQQCRGRDGEDISPAPAGMSLASAANHTQSTGSYRTRPACRRRTAFSCRSTSSSASFARFLTEYQDSQAE
jgi:hypothetical protein